MVPDHLTQYACAKILYVIHIWTTLSIQNQKVKLPSNPTLHCKSNYSSWSFIKNHYIFNTLFLEEVHVLTCLVCNETEAGCKEEPEDAKVVECQLNDPDGPNYGNACLISHNGNTS